MGVYMNTIGMKFWYKWHILATNAQMRLFKPARAFIAHKHKEHVEIKPRTKIQTSSLVGFLSTCSRGYNTFFMLNITEHEISNAHKN